MQTQDRYNKFRNIADELDRIAEEKQKARDEWEQEMKYSKKPKMFAKGSKFTRPKKKRKK